MTEKTRTEIELGAPLHLAAGGLLLTPVVRATAPCAIALLVLIGRLTPEELKRLL